MTIVITPTLAKAPTRSASTDGPANAETPAAEADFARLLLGQIAADANLVPETPVITTTLDANFLDPAASPQDAASLLAALGMAAPQNGKLPTDSVDRGPLLTTNDKKTSSVLLADAPADSATVSLETDVTSRSELSVPLEVNGKAAKFAAGEFPLSKTDALAIKSLPHDGSGPQAPVAAALSPNQTGNTILTASAPLRVDTPVRDPAWSSDFSQKVVWLTTNEQKFAQLTLNPPQMGPIEISININKDSASAYFVSANADVREAIETALPRLREMLAGVGIELGQANVSAQSSRHEADNPDKRQGAPRWMSDETILGADSGLGQAAIARRGSGLVDTFA